ncbi:IS66 family transposase [Lysinibacillus antri]|uniref:IS66 family transposase n=1 Tax=Lysinibacillus antri TaxID=2498145 RepID=A0A3S0WDX0_9BACI|nr:IS66 family transposase [Lysinibacillus antri]RUL45628.1 IS66 family transposase [Lysinibacillus antri]
MSNTSQDKVIQLLEDQLAFMKEQNKGLSKQIEVLTEQVRQLTKALYGTKSEKSKYQVPDGQCSLFEDDPSFNESEHTEKQSTETVSYTVVRKIRNKKRNDSFSKELEIEEVHHHPSNLQCDCCQSKMFEIGCSIAREEAKFIPAKMVRVQHIEHAYECKQCKKDTTQNAQIKRGKAPMAVISRSIAGPTVLAKLIYDKFIQYLPLYRQVKEWERSGLMTNDKNLSNWVIRVAEEWLLPIYEQMRNVVATKSILHIDETYAKILKRSDGKPGQSNAYLWVFKSIPSQGPVIVLFQSALTRSRPVLEEFTKDFKGTVICDGYSAYDKLPNITFANCWAHLRRYWLKADSKNGRIGVSYCDQLYQLERKFKNYSPGKRRRMRKKYSKPIVEKFLTWVQESPFFGKNALAKAAEYTLNRVQELKAFLKDGRIEIDNNPAENAIRPSVIGRKNWLFSVSEAGARANAICLSLVETAKANGIDFYKYLVKLFTELPNLPIHQQPEILQDYMPWSKSIQATCIK